MISRQSSSYKSNMRYQAQHAQISRQARITYPPLILNASRITLDPGNMRMQTALCQTPGGQQTAKEAGELVRVTSRTILLITLV